MFKKRDIKQEIEKSGYNLGHLSIVSGQRLQKTTAGFPTDYKIPKLADSALYKQFGNSVSVPVIEAVGKQMMRAME